MSQKLFNKVYDLLKTFDRTISSNGRTLSVHTKLATTFDIKALYELSRLASVTVKGLQTGEIRIVVIIPVPRKANSGEKEKLLIHYLSQGMKQYQIAEAFKQKGIKPNSVRNVELAISKLKEGVGGDSGATSQPVN